MPASSATFKFPIKFEVSRSVEMQAQMRDFDDEDEEVELGEYEEGLDDDYDEDEDEEYDEELDLLGDEEGEGENDKESYSQ